jgi:uncharacterized protein with PQ loop repeat
MNSSLLQLVAGFGSSTIFIGSKLPMLLKAFKTKDLKSYSLGHLVLGNLGNAVYWLYVISLPVGPVWFLQAFFSIVSVMMLFFYLYYEKNWFHFTNEKYARRTLRKEVDENRHRDKPAGRPILPEAFSRQGNLLAGSGGRLPFRSTQGLVHADGGMRQGIAVAFHPRDKDLNFGHEFGHSAKTNPIWVRAVVPEAILHRNRAARTPLGDLEKQISDL